MRGPGVALVAALLGGCYSPAPPSGGFSCTGSDTACPDGQHCTCGLCVKSDSDAVCALALTVDTTPINQEVDCPTSTGATGSPQANTLCVFEQQTFPVTVTAYSDPAGTVPSKFTGMPSFDATWGTPQATLVSPFSSGVAQLTLALDRATPSFRVYVTARVGDARGAASSGLFVDPPPYTVAPAADISAPFGWAKNDVGYPAVDVSPADGKRTMYFSGVDISGGNTTVAIGAAAWDPATMTWTPPDVPLFSPPPPVGTVSTGYISPSVLRTGDGTTRVLFDQIVTGTTSDLLVASRPNDGASFGAPAAILSGSDCQGCEGSGPLYPWALLDPSDPGEWLLFFSGVNKSMQATAHLSIGRSVDQGSHWNIDPVPTPGNRILSGSGVNIALAARVVWDASSTLYRMWFVSLDGKSGACAWQIFYATSSDGTLWTGTRDTVAPLTAADVPWAAPLVAAGGGLQPGSIEPPAHPGDPYTLWFSPVVLYKNPLNPMDDFCIPVSIGQATRN